MKLVPYSVVELATRRVKYSGHSEAQFVPKATADTEVVVGIAANPDTDEISVGGKVRKAAKTRRELWRESLPQPEPDEAAVVLEALKAKLSPAELAAAASRLRARRVGAA